MRAVAVLLCSFLILAAFHVSYSIVDANSAVHKEALISDDAHEEKAGPNVVHELTVKNHRKKDLMRQTVQALAQTREEDAMTEADGNNGDLTEITTMAPNMTETPKGKGRKVKDKSKTKVKKDRKKARKVKKDKKDKTRTRTKKQKKEKKGKKNGRKEGRGRKKIRTTAVPPNNTNAEPEETTEMPTAETREQQQQQQQVHDKQDKENHHDSMISMMLGDEPPRQEKRHNGGRHGGGSRHQICNTDVDCADGCCIQKGARKFCKRGHPEGRRCTKKCSCATGLECYATNRKAKKAHRSKRPLFGKCTKPSADILASGFYMTAAPPVSTTAPPSDTQ